RYPLAAVSDMREMASCQRKRFSGCRTEDFIASNAAVCLKQSRFCGLRARIRRCFAYSPSPASFLMPMRFFALRFLLRLLLLHALALQLRDNIEGVVHLFCEPHNLQQPFEADKVLGHHPG